MDPSLSNTSCRAPRTGLDSALCLHDTQCASTDAHASDMVRVAITRTTSRCAQPRALSYECCELGNVNDAG